MEIDIAGRHIAITSGLRDHVMGKMQKLDKYTLTIVSAHVVFEVQKIAQVCEIVLSGKNLRMTARETTSDMYASFDAAVANLQKQLARYHEKIKDHRTRPNEISTEEDTRLQARAED